MSLLNRSSIPSRLNQNLDFEPTDYYPSYADYCAYRHFGSLVLTAENQFKRFGLHLCEPQDHTFGILGQQNHGCVCL